MFFNSSSANKVKAVTILNLSMQNNAQIIDITVVIAVRLLIFEYLHFFVQTLVLYNKIKYNLRLTCLRKIKETLL